MSARPEILSARLSREALNVLDAHAAHLSYIRAVPVSRADVIELWARSVKGPEGLGPTYMALRIAVKNLAAVPPRTRSERSRPAKPGSRDDEERPAR